MPKEEEKRRGCLPFFLRFLATPANEPEATAETLDLEYELRGNLLSDAERFFYKRLLEAVGSKLTVFAQVRIADVLEIKKGANRNRLFPKISQKHFDFILCHPGTLQILAAIELDDSTHSLPKRQTRDRFVNQACESAELNLIRVAVAQDYDVKQLRLKIQNAIRPKKRQSGE